MQLDNNKNSLSIGYLLHWYEIKKILGRGGFGITYLAQDNNLGRFVAIKEFMPEDFASRESNNTVHPKTTAQKELYDWGLQRFVDEARTLAKFNHPNIVRVLSVFEENNTAYMVMEYAVGEDLSHIYKKSNVLNEDALLDIFIPIMDGLALVHNAGFIHRDIKPANIYICENNSPLLIDFGSARQSVSGKTRALTSLVTYGYAPFEQYNEGAEKQGPWTDIYSLGASLYTGITGKKPLDAMARGGSLLDKGFDIYEPASIVAKGKYSQQFLLAVDRALMFKVEDRPTNILECADMLLGKTPAPPLPENMLEYQYSAATIVRSASDTEPNSGVLKNASPTGTQSGTQGLIDAHGRRNSGRVNATAEHFFQGPARASGEEKNTIKIWIGLIVIALIALLLLVSFGGVIDAPEEIDKTVQAEKNITEKTQQKTLKDKQNQNKVVISELLKSAEQAFSAGNYISPAGKSAYDFYNKILAKQKNNLAATAGLKNIEKELLNLARSAYFEKQYVRADKYLQQLIKINPKSAQANSLLNRLNSEQNQQAQIKKWLADAEKYFKNKRYTNPKNNNAYALFSKVLSRQADNTQAKNGIKKIQKFYIDSFERNLSLKRLSQAERSLAVIKKIAVPSNTVRSMEKRLDTKQKKYKVKQKTLSQKAHPQKLNVEKVSQKISQFKSAIQSGNKDALNKISVYSAGRQQFVNKLLVKYQSITVMVSRLQLIVSKNKAKARVELTELIDVNSETVKAGDWGQFEIVLRYNKNNELKVFW